MYIYGFYIVVFQMKCSFPRANSSLLCIKWVSRLSFIMLNLPISKRTHFMTPWWWVSNKIEKQSKAHSQNMEWNSRCVVHVIVSYSCCVPFKCEWLSMHLNTQVQRLITSYYLFTQHAYIRLAAMALPLSARLCVFACVWEMTPDATSQSMKNLLLKK